MFCKQRLGPRRAARRDRPRQAERERRLAGGRRTRSPRPAGGSSPRSPRRSTSAAAGRGLISICAAGGQGVVAILEKRSEGGRPMTDRYSQIVNSRIGGLHRRQRRAAAAGRARPLLAGPAGDRRRGAARRGAGSPARRPGRGDPRVGRRRGADRAARRGSRRRGRGRPRRLGLELRTRPRTRGSRRSSSTRPGITDSAEPARAARVLPPDDPRASRRPAAWSCSGPRPRRARSPREATAQRALEGFTRSVGKEVRRGALRAARLRRARRRGSARLHAPLPALAALGLRVRPGRADRRAGRRIADASTGTRRCTARSRW